ILGVEIVDELEHLPLLEKRSPKGKQPSEFEHLRELLSGRSAKGDRYSIGAKLIIQKKNIFDFIDTLTRVNNVLHVLDRNSYVFINEFLGPKVEAVYDLQVSLLLSNTKELTKYLRDSNPKRDLETLKSQLEKLYAVLIEQFSVKELLLKVGDRRLLDMAGSDVLRRRRLTRQRASDGAGQREPLG